jgi:hypothetical protein
MPMHNPPHPGTFIEAVYLQAVCPLHRALRLSRVLAMQDSYDLWQARQSLDLSGLTPMELTAA